MSINEEIKKIISQEARALTELSQKIPIEINSVISEICICKGKIVVTGMGKTGIIARKISASLASTGTNSVYLHPADAIHGDLGMVMRDDIIIMISNSGETEELIEMIPYFRNHNNRIFLMTGNLSSSLAKEADFVMDIGVPSEFEPLGIVPTVSTTTALAMGNAIVSVVMKQKNFQKEDFALRHPGGFIGKRLLLKVKDIMHSGNENPVVKQDVSLKNAILVMTSKGLGCINIVNDEGKLVGMITDGDLRRILQEHKNPLNMEIKSLMTSNPIHITPQTSGIDTLELMEKHAITMLPVVDDDGKPIALVHMHDLIKAGLVKK
ncbi:MAG: KpsF/GutQ family sugar-phosphate isomerase [Candidatus Cloacimonadota bacterium]|nr:KpsF/GutQ family sugar-phosphate isomerase [Candidatus Cloacimonadota bacterium]